MKRRKYEVVGGPLDGKYVAVGASSNSFVAAGYKWGIFAKKIILCAGEPDTYGKEGFECHTWRLAICKKKGRKYWSYCGLNASLDMCMHPRIMLNP